MNRVNNLYFLINSAVTNFNFKQEHFKQQPSSFAGVQQIGFLAFFSQSQFCGIKSVKYVSEIPLFRTASWLCTEDCIPSEIGEMKPKTKRKLSTYPLFTDDHERQMGHQ